MTVPSESAVDMEKLLHRKLNLVVDLDHTLVHSVPLDYYEALGKHHDSEFLRMEQHAQDIHVSDELKAVVKVRPGTRELLSALRDDYNLYIYTMGTREYAQHVRSILDPEGDIFHERVMSRCDAPNKDQKKLTYLGLRDRDTLILDDTPQVWASHIASLLQVDRYMFFPEHVCGPSRFTYRRDETDDTNILGRIQRALERVYATHTETRSGDCRVALEKLRMKVLRNFVVHIDGTVDGLQRNKQVALANILGAKICSEKMAKVSRHVCIAAEQGHIGKMRDAPKVSLNWLKSCYMNMCPMDMTLFKL